MHKLIMLKGNIQMCLSFCNFNNHKCTLPPPSVEVGKKQTCSILSSWQVVWSESQWRPRGYSGTVCSWQSCLWTKQQAPPHTEKGNFLILSFFKICLKRLKPTSCQLKWLSQQDGAILCGVCIFSLCLSFLSGALVTSHISNIQGTLIDTRKMYK